MPEAQKTVLWDFDGTLAQRPHMWSGAMIEALDVLYPEHSINIDDIRPLIRGNFPWDDFKKPHHHLSAPGAWWAHTERILANAYEAAGFDGEQSTRLAALAHSIYVNPKGFELFDDTMEALEHFRSTGWRNVIVSNHVPELNEIVDGLGIGRYFYACFSSANMGFEKPNPEAFNVALSFCGYPCTVWMVGDNAEADVKGANALGIPAVLVHADNKSGVKYHTETLKDVIRIIEDNS